MRKPGAATIAPLLVGYPARCRNSGIGVVRETRRGATRGESQESTRPGSLRTAASGPVTSCDQRRNNYRPVTTDTTSAATPCVRCSRDTDSRCKSCWRRPRGVYRIQLIDRRAVQREIIYPIVLELIAHAHGEVRPHEMSDVDPGVGQRVLEHSGGSCASGTVVDSVCVGLKFVDVGRLAVASGRS